MNDRERRLRRKTHDTIRRATTDLDPRVHLNTVISAMMELVNELYAFCAEAGIGGVERGGATASSVSVGLRAETTAVLREAVDALVRMLSPFAPHFSEELWERLGHQSDITAAGWPTFDLEVARPDELVIPVQVNGKVRARLTVGADVDDQALRGLALSDPKVKAHVAGKSVDRVVIAGRKLVSIVAK